MCTTQIITQLLICLNEQTVSGSSNAVYLDFKKAFASVHHRKFTSKLKAYGIRGKIYHRLGDFLTRREQHITVGETVSNWAVVKSGIAQGNVLEPVSFVLLMNDLLDSAATLVKISIDDTKFIGL